jgi:hypothetical protein
MAVESIPRSDPPAEAPLPPLLKRRWFVPAVAAGGLLGMIVLAIGLAAFAIWLSRAKAEREVAAEVARIQAAGEPITVKDFYAWHRVPKGTADLTSTWLGILAMTKGKFADDGRQLPIVGEGDRALLRADAPDSLLTRAESYLAERQEIIAAAHTAASQPGECRYPLQFEDGIGALVEHAQDMRGVARILSLDVRVKLERGDVAGALTSLKTTIVAGQTLQHQPTLVEQLVRVAVVGVALSDAEHMLNEAELTDEQLTELSATIAAIDPRTGLESGTLGERGMGFHTFHHLETLGEQAGPLVKGSHGKLSRPEDCLLYLQYMEEWIEASREPFPEGLKQVKAVETRLKQQVGSANVLDKLRYSVTFMMLPAIGAGSDAHARQQAQRDLMLAAIAAERFRQQTGTWPQQMNELVPDYLPAVPGDPFDGQPLRMRLEGAEIVIYSVGADGQDNQGVSEGGRGLPDIVVRVKAPLGEPSSP